MILGCIIIGIVLAYFLVERQKEADRQQHFQQSDYFAQTGHAYYDVKTNAGKRANRVKYKSRGSNIIGN